MQPIRKRNGLSFGSLSIGVVSILYSGRLVFILQINFLLFFILFFLFLLSHYHITARTSSSSRFCPPVFPSLVLSSSCYPLVSYCHSCFTPAAAGRQEHKEKKTEFNSVLFSLNGPSFYTLSLIDDTPDTTVETRMDMTSRHAPY